MRDFIDAILAFIDAASLNDDEFDLVTVTDQAYNDALYTNVLLILDSRESVSSVRDRLGFYFKARGVDISETPAAKSQIYLGGSLCS